MARLNRRRFLRASSGLFIPAWFGITRAQEMLCPGPIMRTIGSAAPVNPYTGYGAWYKADAGVLNTSDAAASDAESVKTWQDQSGNGLHVTVASANPVYKTGIVNGLPVVRFETSAGRGFAKTGVSLVKNVSGATFFAVVVQNGNITGLKYIVWASISSSYSSARMCLYSGATNTGLYYGGRRQDADADDIQSGTTLSLGTWVLVSGVLDYANGTKDLYINGSSVDHDGTFSSGGGNTDNTTSSYFFIGGNSLAAANTFSGDIAEILVYPTALSTANRQTTESYLNGRYAIF